MADYNQNFMADRARQRALDKLREEELQRARAGHQPTLEKMFNAPMTKQDVIDTNQANIARNQNIVDQPSTSGGATLAGGLDAADKTVQLANSQGSGDAKMDIGSGALSGAAAGSAFGIPGAIVGGVAGGTMGALKSKSAKKAAAKALAEARDKEEREREDMKAQARVNILQNLASGISSALKIPTMR